MSTVIADGDCLIFKFKLCYYTRFMNRCGKDRPRNALSRCKTETPEDFDDGADAVVCSDADPVSDAGLTFNSGSYSLL